MTGKSYVRSIKKFDFKNYKVTVKSEGTCPYNLRLKVYLNDKEVYCTRKGDFAAKTITAYKYTRKWIFIQYKPYTVKRIVWNNQKSQLRFNSWTKNYKVNTIIQTELKNAIKEFENIKYGSFNQECFDNLRHCE